jgi:hypothetical protein
MNLAMARAVLGFGAITALTLIGAGCANSGGDPTCDPACPTFYMCCDGTGGVSCRAIVSDPDNCGGCGISCPSRVCREAACVAGPAPDGGTLPGVDSSIPTGDCSPSCSSTQRCCGTTCVSRMVATGGDGRSDPSFSNCNGCGIACDMNRASACSVPGGGAGMPRCMCGVYDQCGAGQVCANSGGTFSCVSTASDPMNCGMIGNACAMGESCVAGMCQCGSTGAACASGQACCSGMCIDSQSDAMNCGGCGMACAAGETCTAGSCGCGTTGMRCDPPMAGTFGSGGSLGESCCDGACIANSDSNCGCGVVCDTASDDTCQVGGDLLGMGMGPAQICCGGEEVAFFGCGGGLGGDAGFPFP